MAIEESTSMTINTTTPKKSVISNKTSRLVSAALLSIGLLGTGLISGCMSFQSQGPTATTGYGVPAMDRTLAQRLLDTSIKNTALTNINAIDPTLYRRSRIGLDSFNSHVLLTGEVPDDKTKQQILTIVSSMPDVKQVHDAMIVGPQKGASYTVHDAYISSKINGKIVANPNISASQLRVVTNDGAVYIMGKLTPSQRNQLLNILENTVGIRKLELLTELVDDNGLPLDADNISQEDGLAPPIYNGQGNNSFLTRVKSKVNTLIDKVNPNRVNNAAQQTAPVYPQPQYQPVQPNTVQPSAVPQNGQGYPYQNPNANNNQTINQNVINQGTTTQNGAYSAPVVNTPVANTPPRGNTTNSPYIDMYKNQVAGWQ